MLTCLTAQVGPEDSVIALDHSWPRRLLISVCWVHSHPGKVELDGQSLATRMGPRGSEGSLVSQTGCHMSSMAWKKEDWCGQETGSQIRLVPTPPSWILETKEILLLRKESVASLNGG